jgi:hypothetical protein
LTNVNIDNNVVDAIEYSKAELQADFTVWRRNTFRNDIATRY